METIRKKEAMEPGKRYRGYGFINEFKEFCFEPEQTGAHEGREKSICVKDGVRVSETKNLIIVKFNIEKQEQKSLYFRLISQIFNTLTKIFQTYEI